MPWQVQRNGLACSLRWIIQRVHLLDHVVTVGWVAGLQTARVSAEKNKK
ncbi:hypothetical protein [Streptomyces sp. NPDC090057]